MKIKLLNESVLVNIRRNQTMYIPRSNLKLDAVLLDLVRSDLMHLGIADYTVDTRNSWVIVSSPLDWLQHGQYNVSSVCNFFNTVSALPEAGQNSIRHEIVVKAFSRSYITKSSDSIDAFDDEIGDIGIEIVSHVNQLLTENCKRVLAFVVS